MGKTILVVTPCPRKSPPTQGFIIAQRLRLLGFRTSVLSSVQSSLFRALDIVCRGFLLIPFHNVVFVNLYGNRAFVYESLIILYAYIWKKRIVVFVHSGLMPRFIQRWPKLTRFVIYRSDLILVPNGFLKEKFTTQGVRVDGVIPNFIDLEQYRFKERLHLEPRFLYVRGFWSVYNPEMALRAFALIQGQYPEASLTMVGREGDCSESCRSLVSELGLRNVHFIGLVSKSKLLELAEEHHIHLHTNRSENMPVSIIEMWACGLPIVGTNVGGMPYLVQDNEDAILVESEDFNAMAQMCIKLLSEPDLARRLSRNGRKRAEELTWDRVKTTWLNALFVGD